MSYAIDDLGPLDFERMVQALLVAAYGPTLRTFGTGRDDGRDAVFDAHVDGDPRGGRAPEWVGYHVFQAKFHERPGSPSANRAWLLAQVRAELSAWTQTVRSRGTIEFKRKGQRPEFFVVLTNVALSGQAGGGIDAVETAIKDAAAKSELPWPLKDCQVWDRSKIERLLDAHADVRHKFNGLLTVGDVLAALKAGNMLPPTTNVAVALPFLEEHARIELARGERIKLGEAGESSNQRLDLAEAAIDLKAEMPWDHHPRTRIERRRGLLLDDGFLHRTIEIGNGVQRPSVRKGATPHLLLVGGPGQGKTTLGKILVRTYRAAMLQERESLTADVNRAIEMTLLRAEQIGLPRITNRRWPFWIDLAEYASRVAGGSAVPLVRYIANEISALVGDNFSFAEARGWLRAWPWLIVLDGYDEVASAAAREEVARAVEALLQAAQTEDADLLIIATTRPQGYGDELPSALLRCELLRMSSDDALAYAARLTDLRLRDDSDKPDVMARIAAAVHNEVTGRLMRTPLQVMILSLLMESRRRPPQDRAALFQAYYDRIYEREIQKKNYLSELLAQHRPDIDAIHYKVGLRLQARSEGGGDGDAAMPANELREIVRERLMAQEHEGAELERLLDNLTRAAQDRLVLLTATGKSHVGFELRSLQEYMAAQALVTGGDRRVMDALSVVAPSAHWRNTWLLATGTLYRTHAHRFEAMLSRIGSLDHDNWLSILAPTGARMALDILDDGVASANPRYTRVLVDEALNLLSGVNLGARRLGQVLADQGTLKEVTRARIASEIERAIAGTPETRRAAKLVLLELAGEGRSGPLATKSRQLLSTHFKHERDVDEQDGQTIVTFADALPRHAEAWTPDSPAGLFYLSLSTIQTTSSEAGLFTIPEGFSVPASARKVVNDQDATRIVVEAINGIPQVNWSARAFITSLLLRARERQPVADLLDDR